MGLSLVTTLMTILFAPPLFKGRLGGVIQAKLNPLNSIHP